MTNISENYLITQVLTVNRSTVILGLAAWYKMYNRLTPIPTTIPNSKGSTKQATNVVRATKKQLPAKLPKNFSYPKTPEILPSVKFSLFLFVVIK